MSDRTLFRKGTKKACWPRIVLVIKFKARRPNRGGASIFDDRIHDVSRTVFRERNWNIPMGAKTGDPRSLWLIEGQDCLLTQDRSREKEREDQKCSVAEMHSGSALEAQQ